MPGCMKDFVPPDGELVGGIRVGSMHYWNAWIRHVEAKSAALDVDVNALLDEQRKSRNTVRIGNLYR